MILELIEYLVTPCSWSIRKLGYLNQQLGIKVRHRQCRRAWKPHLERTKNFIRRAVLECPQRRKAVILGSGLLLDIPLSELASTFREVILVDVIHPMNVIAATWWRRNVRLIRADVTGTAQELAKIARSPNQPLPRSRPELFCNDPEVDLVVSVNLLSQLPYVPSYYLEKSRPESEVDAYAHDLILSHLDYLQRLPGIVTLITDVEKLQVNPNGNTVAQFDILYGAAVPWESEGWDWEHIPIGHVSSEYGLHRRVCGVLNVKTAALIQASNDTRQKYAS